SEVKALGVGGEQALERGLLEKVVHGLASVLRDDLVVVLVRDEGDVRQGGEELVTAEGLAAQDRVAEQDDALARLVGERAEPELGIEAQELGGQAGLHP